MRSSTQASKETSDQLHQKVARQADNWPDVILKASAGTGEVVARVYNGELLTVLQEEGENVKVCRSVKEGWCRTEDLVIPKMARQADGWPEVVLKASAGTGESVVHVKNGELVTVLQEEGEHVQVRWNGKEGWAKASNLAPAKFKVAKQADGWPEVVLRATAGTGEAVVHVKNDELLTVLQEEGEHVKVFWFGQEGWAKASNLGPAKVCDVKQQEGWGETTLKDLARTGDVVAKVHDGEHLMVFDDVKSIPSHLCVGEHLILHRKVRRFAKEGWVKATNLEPVAQFVVARQAENHPKVVLRDAPTLRHPFTEGKMVAMVPNGQDLKVLDQGAGTESVKVSWEDKEGWVRRKNVQQKDRFSSMVKLLRAQSEDLVHQAAQALPGAAQALPSVGREDSRGGRQRRNSSLTRECGFQTSRERGLRHMHSYNLSDSMTRTMTSDLTKSNSRSMDNRLLDQISMGDYGQKLPEEPEIIKVEEDLRKKVLLETLRKLELERSDCIRLAEANLNRWREAAKEKGGDKIRVMVMKGDWGEITGKVVKEHGEIFAALNMANAYAPGGGYNDGLIAQEENMFRRTDCHFSLTDKLMNRGRDTYHSFETDLINAVSGEVYLDKENPRVCIRGKEERGHFPNDLGYEWLAEDQYFLFYELRSAAEDLRDGRPFVPQEMRKRIRAQLHTCSKHHVKHVVLSAFGCGAFLNPADVVAKIYYEEVALVKAKFVCIVFAIFHAGYGADNFTPFEQVFQVQPEGPECVKVHQTVHLRENPSGNVIMQVPADEVLTVLSREGDNVKVRWKITEGWAISSNLG